MLFKLRKLDKNGSAVYGAEGLRGSIYFSKNLFGGDVPQDMEIPYDGFAPPGEARTPKTPTPEQIEKAKASVAKAEERLRKAQERADKAAERAAKYSQPVPETVQ